MEHLEKQLSDALADMRQDWTNSQAATSSWAEPMDAGAKGAAAQSHTPPEPVPGCDDAPAGLADAECLSQAIDIILDEIQRNRVGETAASAMCAEIRERLGNLFQRRTAGELRAYDLALKHQVSGKSWFYLLFVPPVSGMPAAGLLFVSPGVAHSARVAGYFQGGVPSSIIQSVIRPAKVEIGDAQLPVKVLEFGEVK